MQLQKAIKKRKSVKNYSHKKPSWKKILQALDSVRFAPMAGNQYSLKFILVQEPDKIKKIAQCCQQNFVAKAHYVVVAVSNVDKITKSYGKRGEDFAKQQAGAAIQNFLLSLTEKGLETTWVGYLDDQTIKRELEIQSGFDVEAVFPIGEPTRARTELDKEKKKPDLDDILYFDKWKNKYMQPKTRVKLENA